MRCRLWLIFLLATPNVHADEIEAARQRWSESPHGPFLERILPPGFEAKMLPESGSRGARLALRYCVQCHHLANPAMHDARRWPVVVERMVQRMQGRGNMGKLMTEMMAGVVAPAPQETKLLVAYLRRHAQRPLDPKKIADVNGPAGEPFRLACGQCHALPDPRRYTAREWPAVVTRMQKNMEWMNRVVSARPASGEPQLRVEDINAFLAKYAKRQ